MEKINIIFLIIFIICLLIFCNIYQKYQYDNIESFSDKNNSNSKYNKYTETNIGTNDSSYKKVKNVTLEECKSKCNNDSKCIGFTRESKLTDDQEGNCYLKNKLENIHNIRRGNPKQRHQSSKINSFVKVNLPLQELKCLGSPNTLNTNISLKSHKYPLHNIGIIEHSVKLKKYVNKNDSFNKEAIFKIVAGLEGSGTVSFLIEDNKKEKYYLCNLGEDQDNKLGILPIEINESRLETRRNASFEILDGDFDDNSIVLRTYSLVGKNKYLRVLQNSNKLQPLEFTDLKTYNETSNKKIYNFKIEIANINEGFRNIRYFPQQMRCDMDSNYKNCVEEPFVNLFNKEELENRKTNNLKNIVNNLLDNKKIHNDTSDHSILNYLKKYTGTDYDKIIETLRYDIKKNKKQNDSKLEDIYNQMNNIQNKYINLNNNLEEYVLQKSSYDVLFDNIDYNKNNWMFNDELVQNKPKDLWKSIFSTSDLINKIKDDTLPESIQTTTTSIPTIPDSLSNIQSGVLLTITPPTTSASLPTTAASPPTTVASLPTTAASLPTTVASLPTTVASLPTIASFQS